MEWWQVLVSILGGILLVWIALIGAIAWVSRGQSEKITLIDAVRFGPDVVPDFIRVIGYADDVIVVGLVLRFATRHAGAAALDRHWPGTPQGLNALRALVSLN
jgi:hypothetical protein